MKNEYLKLELPDAADTLSGLIISELGRPPGVGDEITIGETVMRVEVRADLGVSIVSLQTATGDISSKVGEWDVDNHA